MATKEPFVVISKQNNIWSVVRTTEKRGSGLRPCERNEKSISVGFVCGLLLCVFQHMYRAGALFELTLVNLSNVYLMDFTLPWNHQLILTCVFVAVVSMIVENFGFRQSARWWPRDSSTVSWKSKCQPTPRWQCFTTCVQKSKLNQRAQIGGEMYVCDSDVVWECC